MTWSDRARALAAAALLAPALLAGAGCRRAEPGFLLLPRVQAKELAGLSFRRPPEIATLAIEHERRPVVLAAPGTWSWHGEVPQGAVLHAGVQTLPAVWQAVRRLDVEIVARDGDTREVLDVRSAGPTDTGWLDLEIDLGRWSGRTVTLEFSSSLDGLPPKYRDANLVAWGPVALEAAAPRRAERPNILFILVDTLRADHLTPYGYAARDTSPEIQRRLAAPGAVVETAYSQAPWTLPSVVSFMTGRQPGELLGDDPAAFGIPDGVTPLAERLATLGYDTGGFVANPLLHEGAGFDRGFRTYYAPPAQVEWLSKHADELNRHAVPWLRAHQRHPFFLYVHYVDPHDPYENPDMIANRAQFMPDYTGPVNGEWIHGIYSGKLQLPEPERDLAYIKALYDGEVHYVDRFLGALLDQIDPEVLKNTLIVLTADHGEELYDHGGWKHGQTLYQEQIHVPLIFRWDGRIPAGRRVPGTVRLLDLLPTLAAAAGGKADPSWEGVDLLPALTGKAAVPRRPAFAEGLSGGPLRAAAVLGNEKLLLFNREEPYRPADELQAHLWQKDLGRLRRAELYDLEKDPGERQDLAAGPHPDAIDRMDRLQPVIHDQLGRELPGLWVVPDGLREGARLSGSITCERPPAGWVPYFLAPFDRVEPAGAEIRFEIAGERLTKGLRLLGCGRVTAVSAALDGQPLPPGAVQTGVPSGPRPSSPVLHLWQPAERSAAERRNQKSQETEEGLRNLGYIGAGKKDTRNRKP